MKEADIWNPKAIPSGALKGEGQGRKTLQRRGMRVQHIAGPFPSLDATNDSHENAKSHPELDRSFCFDAGECQVTGTGGHQDRSQPQNRERGSEHLRRFC